MIRKQVAVSIDPILPVVSEAAPSRAYCNTFSIVENGIYSGLIANRFAEGHSGALALYVRAKQNTGYLLIPTKVSTVSFTTKSYILAAQNVLGFTDKLLTYTPHCKNFSKEAKTCKLGRNEFATKDCGERCPAYVKMQFVASQTITIQPVIKTDTPAQVNLMQTY